MQKTDLYFKKHQRNGIYHFAKRMNYLDPPASEVINFLNDIPILQHQEYDLSSPGDQIDFDAFLEDWEEILPQEYKHAFAKATAGDFKVYINGELQD